LWNLSVGYQFFDAFIDIFIFNSYVRKQFLNAYRARSSSTGRPAVNFLRLVEIKFDLFRNIGISIGSCYNCRVNLPAGDVDGYFIT
jgi:hypothetical protein